MNPEPLELIAGDTWQWKRTSDLCTYQDANGNTQYAKASASWVLTYALVKVGTLITITASDSVDDFAVLVAAATTAGYAAGTYSWQAYVTKGSERHQIDFGTITVKLNLAAQSSGYDNRSHVKKTLDAIEAVIENRASADQQSYSIAGRQLTRIPLPELIKFHQQYQAAYNSELAGERIRKGMGTNEIIMVRL